jgi:uncharacterized protein YggE
VDCLLALEGGDKDVVVHALSALVARLTERVVRDHRPDAGPITWYSQGQLRNFAQRPWNKDGKQLPMVYSSQADMKIKFSTLGQLFTFVEEITAWDGVRVRGIDWSLTEAAEQAAAEQAQTAAVHQAHAKALRYAQAAGFAGVHPLMIADAGLLVQNSAPAESVPAAFRLRGRSEQGSEEQTFSPEDVTIACTVDAEFKAKARSD